MRTASAIKLMNEKRQELQRMARSNTVSRRMTRRAPIVLLAPDGLKNKTIGERLGIGRVQVGRWRERFTQRGLAAIEADLPRSGLKARDLKSVERT
jgi:FixJ family two-component response regulator